MNLRWLLVSPLFLAPLTHGAPGADGPAATAAPVTYVSATQIADRIEQARAAAKAGSKPTTGALLSSGSIKVGFDYHQQRREDSDKSPIMVAHTTSAELLVIVAGSGTVTMGGTLVDPALDTSPNAPDRTTMIAKRSTGSSLQKVGKGDIVLVPPNTPHSITHTDGELVIAYVHIPVSEPTAK